MGILLLTSMSLILNHETVGVLGDIFFLLHKDVIFYSSHVGGCCIATLMCVVITELCP